MIKNIVIGVQFILIIILCVLLYNYHLSPKDFERKVNKVLKSNLDTLRIENTFKNAKLKFELIPSENDTWGYKILLDNNPIILQPNKPGLPGNAGFKTKEKAQKVAELAINKIRKGQMPPTITIQELDSLGCFK